MTATTTFPVGATLIGLHGHPGTDTGDSFDELRVGLDHVAFGCAERAALGAWQARLEALGIEHGGVRTRTSPAPL